MTDQGCADLLAAGFVGVIVQAITGTDGKSYTRQQLAAALRNGLRIRGYTWAFPGSSAGSLTSRLALFDGFAIEHLYHDLEQSGETVSGMDRDLALCDAYLGRKAGIYTARQVYANLGLAGVTKWSDRDLWDAHWDGVIDVDANFLPYGGWDHCQVKQYGGENSIGSVHQIDLNIAR